MFDIPKPVLVLAAILAIAAGLGILVFAWQMPEGKSFDRAVWAGGGVFLLVAGLISSAILWKTRGSYFED